MTAAADPLGLFNQIQSTLADYFAMFDLVDEEVARLAPGHPEAADLLHHAWSLAIPTYELMGRNPELFRGHVRELLQRVAAGQDTRPGTAAEVCLVCMKTSLDAPLTTSAGGLYLRSFKAAFGSLDMLGGDADSDLARLEASWEREEIDRHDRLVRKRLTQPWRQLSPREIECDGEHNGKPADCRFYVPALFSNPAPSPVRHPRPKAPARRAPDPVPDPPDALF